MKTEISKKLRAARALISDPTCWTQGAYARDSCSRPCEPSAKYAQRFCTAGVMYRVVDHRLAAGLFDGLWESLYSATYVLGGGAPAHFNDTHTHDEVLWAFDLAIAFEEVGT